MKVILKNQLSFEHAIELLYEEMGSYCFDVGLDAGEYLAIDAGTVENHAQMVKILTKAKFSFRVVKS